MIVFAPIVFTPPFEQVPADDALAAAVVLDEPPGEELLVRRDVALHHLLVEHLDEHVPRDVRGIGRARRARGAERALRDPPVLGAREDGAPVLELVDVVGRLVAEDLDRVLVAEVSEPLTVSNACVSGSSSDALPSAALIPPSAAPEWLRVGWIFETSATSAPASNASIAARMPAQPAPTTSTSCLASIASETIGCPVGCASPLTSP